MRAGDSIRRRGGVGGAGAAVMSPGALRAGDCAPCPAPPRRAFRSCLYSSTLQPNQAKQAIAATDPARSHAPQARATRIYKKRGAYAPRTIERRTATARGGRSHPGASPPISRIPRERVRRQGEGAEGAGRSPEEPRAGAPPP